jgi:hypothetical protein
MIPKTRKWEPARDPLYSSACFRSSFTPIYEKLYCKPKKVGRQYHRVSTRGVPGKDGEMKRKSTIIMVVLAAVLSLMPSVILAQSEEAEVSFSLENDLPESIREPFTEESLMEAIEMGEFHGMKFDPPYADIRISYDQQLVIAVAIDRPTPEYFKMAEVESGPAVQITPMYSWAFGVLRWVFDESVHLDPDIRSRLMDEVPYAVIFTRIGEIEGHSIAFVTAFGLREEQNGSFMEPVISGRSAEMGIMLDGEIEQIERRYTQRSYADAFPIHAARDPITGEENGMSAMLSELFELMEAGGL